MNDTLLIVMTVFVIISAVALCIQAAMLIGMKKTTQALSDQVMAVLPQVKSVLAKTEGIVDENRKQIAETTVKVTQIAATANEIAGKASQLADKANQLMDVATSQASRWDAVFTDASERAKVQIERAELVVDDTVGRVHQSVTAVHNGVLKPIREVHGLAAGLRAAMQHMMRGGRPSVADATQDEEMFIG